VALFSESLGRFLVTVAPDDAERFERHFEGLPCRRVGTVTREASLRVHVEDREWLDAGLADLKSPFKETLADA
jgi:phosphoribosylformylglycinamidine synthase